MSLIKFYASEKYSAYKMRKDVNQTVIAAMLDPSLFTFKFLITAAAGDNRFVGQTTDSLSHASNLNFLCCITVAQLNLVTGDDM